MKHIFGSLSALAFIGTLLWYIPNITQFSPYEIVVSSMLMAIYLSLAEANSGG